MSKELFIDPGEKFRKKDIVFPAIPAFTYDKEPAAAGFSKSTLADIYHDMFLIREFENTLLSIKENGKHGSKHFEYDGPVHLAIGQEAASVGVAHCLGVSDFVFGTHRGHADVLAKCMAAIRLLDEDELLSIMEGYMGGRTLRAIENRTKHKKARDLALDYIVYGLAAEIFSRATGLNGGMGGSMHAFFPPFGSYPNNAVVGASAPIAVGAALFKKINRKEGVAVCNIGDGALGCGQVYEAMNFSGMDQFHTLWEDEFKGGLPIVFNIFNNHYGMGGQTSGVTMAFSEPARVGAGMMPNAMHAERVNGMDPLAVIEAFSCKLALARRKQGPALLELVCYRLCGHSASDQNTYRCDEEIEAWRALDPVETFGRKLKDANILTQSEIDSIQAQCRERVNFCTSLALDSGVSPFLPDIDPVSAVMFTNRRVPALSETAPDVLISKEHCPRLIEISAKKRFAEQSDEAGAYDVSDAIFEALLDKFYEDPTLALYSEDVRDWGGPSFVTQGLKDAVPIHRFFDTPISEATIIGSAAGYALSGGRAVVELMFMDFLGRAGDELFNQVAKWQAMSAGELRMPVVVRASIGAKYGAQHSQDWTSLCAHIPGLKVVYPATPYDAKGLLTAALNGTDPVVFIENRRLYHRPELFHPGGVPSEPYEIEIGQPDIKRKGRDVTLLTIGEALYAAIDAADILREAGISAEVIDARSIVPFDYEKVLESVKKTGRIAVIGNGCERGSIMQTMAQTVTELAFDSLKAAPVVIGAKNTIVPAGEYEQYFFPQAQGIAETVIERLFSKKDTSWQKRKTEDSKRGI